MGFTPLTQEQYQKALDAGFTGDQILANEKIRKDSAMSAGAFTEGQQPKSGFATPLTKMDPTGAQGKAMVSGALPLAGSLAGTALGAAGGFAVGGPAGAYVGGVAGSGIGATAGQLGNQAISGQPLDIKAAGKTGAAYGVMEAVGGPLANVAGKTLKGMGEGLAKVFIPTTKNEARMLQNYKADASFVERMKSIFTGEPAKSTEGKAVAQPITAAQTAFDKGLWGPESWIGVQAKRAQGKLWDNLIGPALKQQKEPVDMKGFFDEAQQSVDTKTANDPTQRIALTNALRSIRQDFKTMPTKSWEDFQKVKEGWAGPVPEKRWQGKDITNSVNEVRAQLSELARDKIYTKLGDNVKKAYLDYGNLIGLKELGQKAMTGSGFKGGTGGFLTSFKEMLTVPVGTIGGQTIYKVGHGIELAGPAGVKTLGALLGVGATPVAAPTASNTTPAPQTGAQVPAGMSPMPQSTAQVARAPL